jgi:hypothetical protein
MKGEIAFGALVAVAAAAHAWMDGGSRALDLAVVVMALALGVAAFAAALARRPEAGGRALKVGAGAGVLVASLFFIDATRWLEALTVLGFAAAVGSLVGATRASVRPVGVAFGVGAAPSLVAIAATGGVADAARQLAYAAPLRPAPAIAGASAASTLFVIALAGLQRRRSSPTELGPFALTWGVAGLLLVARVAYVASFIGLPGEMHHAEGPFLADQLKLDQGLPLYGAPERLDAYVYGPLHTLVLRALTAPFDLTYDLAAHRAIGLAMQLGAGAVLAWSIAPHVRGRLGPYAPVWLAAVFSVGAASSWLAATVHPDHGLVLSIAVAHAVALRPEAFGRARLPVVALVTPVALAFKLPGACVGVGLLAIALRERRRADAIAAIVGLALAAATVASFQLTLGDFVFWTIRVQAARPWDASGFGEVARSGAFAGSVAAGLAAVVMWLVERRHPEGPWAPTELDVALSRELTLGAAVVVATLPTAFKYTSRANVLVPAALEVAVVVALVAARHATRARRLHPLFGAAALLAWAWLLAPPRPPLPTSQRLAAERSFARVVEVTRADAIAGRRTLLLVDTAAWIAAGHRDVPRDRLAPAVELNHAESPLADVLVAHVADGRYDTIVAPARSEIDDGRSLGRFLGRLRAALDDRYALEPTPAALDPKLAPRVYRRR